MVICKKLLTLFIGLAFFCGNTVSATATATATANKTVPRPIIDDQQISVSGFSSGAYMAVQLHVAYSSLFMGVGAVAGGPYYCAEQLGPDKINNIKSKCMAGIGSDNSAETYVQAARQAAQTGNIDPLNNLQHDRIFIFNSQFDQVINPALGYLSRLFYQQLVEDADEQIQAWSFIPKFGPLYPVAHGMPTTNPLFNDYGNSTDRWSPCAPSNSQALDWFPSPLLRGNDPWLYHCDMGLFDGYDMAKDILEHIYGPLVRATPANPQHMYAFTQLEHVNDPDIHSITALNQHGLGSQGYIYIPERCHAGRNACRLHVALHGCNQFPEWQFQGKPGSRFSRQTITFDGLFRDHIYNRLAEANDIIVLYPQAHNIGNKMTDINPYGCWEFWPFFPKDQHNYYTKTARTMTMINHIIEDLRHRRLKLQPIRPYESNNHPIR